MMSSALLAALRSCGWAPLRTPALRRCLASSSTLENGGATIQEQLQALRQALAEAVENAEMVGSSAQQLFLETDPAARGPRAQYERHYSEMALIQLHGALDLAKHLREAVGAEEADALLRREKLALPLADAQLWRDRTSATIAAARRQEETNEITCDS